MIEGLLARLVATLDDDPAYERHGAQITDAWGSGQWMRFTDAAGNEHFMRIVVEPYRPPG